VETIGERLVQATATASTACRPAPGEGEITETHRRSLLDVLRLWTAISAPPRATRSCHHQRQPEPRPDDNFDNGLNETIYAASSASARQHGLGRLRAGGAEADTWP
jgi:hypothetical protein